MLGKGSKRCPAHVSWCRWAQGSAGAGAHIPLLALNFGASFPSVNKHFKTRFKRQGHFVAGCVPWWQVFCKF